MSFARQPLVHLCFLVVHLNPSTQKGQNNSIFSETKVLLFFDKGSNPSLCIIKVLLYLKKYLPDKFRNDNN
jgi:hypothetical protein